MYAGVVKPVRGPVVGLLRGDSCIVPRETGVELRSHAVQRSEKHIV